MTSSRNRLATRIALVVVATGALQVAAMSPAFAAAPTISSFTPTSGVIGATVTITGTGFQDASPVTGVAFNGTAATDFTVNSDTSLTVTVPAGATTGTISVTDAENTATSATSFTVAPSPAPTITGTGFTGATDVTFNGIAATDFTVGSDTSITVTVPAGATTGPIAVTTPGGTAAGPADFTVAGGASHQRDVTLALRRHLFARGHVTSDLDACANGVTVEIERRRHGHWRSAASTTTNTAGHYRVDLRDRKGKYRAVVAEETVNGGADTCLAARSPAERHRHRHH